MNLFRTIIAFFLLLGLLPCPNALAQVELQKVIPLSPNAAAVAKYGEIPVGHFTGVPNISIPIYTIQSKELTLPISLSYHAGGNKVEDIASWVGLGWSLGTVPSISRNIRGLPDEGTGGYYDGYLGKTVEENYNAVDPGHWNYFRAIYLGEADTEADIYFYSLPGKSGKFCYNQQLQQFQTIPRSNIKITFTPQANVFTIIDDDGSIYHFDVKETATTSGSGPGSTNITSWYASKIHNMNKTDSLVLGYRDELQSMINLSPVTKYVGCSPPPGSITTITTTLSKVIYTIQFNGGVMIFNALDTERLDLNGGYALNNVEVFNDREQLIKRFTFHYEYFNSKSGGYNCSNASAETKKRLMLNSISQTDPGSTQSHVHEFKYNTTIVPPCRLSPSQDFWGYYNGAENNQDLVPTARISTGQLIQGADRTVNPNTTQFGILTQIKYPTGGYSNFTYENNNVRNNSVPATYTSRSASLSGEPEPTTNIYSDTFTINNPPDGFLNGNQGGAYVKVMSGDVGCNRGSPCAILTLYGYSPTNQHIRWHVNYDFDGHLPNGLYQIKAEFNQDPIQYQNFYFAVSWNEFDSTELKKINKPVGGLRISTIETFDAFGKSSIKKYRYTNDILSDTTSGDIFSGSFFEYFDHVRYNNGDCYRIKAYPNIQGVTHSGSPVGYQKVYEQFGNASESGMIMYEFTNAIDEDQNPFPYAPGHSYEFLRGQPLRTTTYAKKGTGFTPVKKTAYHYLDIIETESTPYGLKTGLTDIGNVDTSQPWEPPVTAQPYNVITGWSAPSIQTEVTYDPDDSTKYSKLITQFEYDPGHHQLTTTDITNSEGRHILTSYSYPPDITMSGDAEIARQDLVIKNNISTVLKTERSADADHLETFTTNFKKNALGIIKPSEIVSKTKNATSENRIKFLRYDTHGNLLEQQKTGDVITAYIWDYNQNLPVAEVINAEKSRIAYTSFETDSTGGWKRNAGGTTKANTIITGRKSYSGGLYKSGLPAGNYIVTLWTSGNVTVNSALPGVVLRSKNGWSYYEWKLSNPGTVQIYADNMDEVRLYPENAQMTTYCYEPLVGTTAVCDVRNDITYYEYDGFSRLLRIRDINANILKQFEYAYQAPARFINAAVSDTFIKNNCGAGYEGTSVTYSVPLGTYHSTTSQQDADQQAQNDLNANGQAYANDHGSCLLLFYNVEKSGKFTRNNCGAGYQGGNYTYKVASGTYSSTVSQALANQMAESDISNNGQTMANQHGLCYLIHYSVEKSSVFTKNDCSIGFGGSTVTYTVPAGTYTSILDQTDANKKAQNDIDTNGQSYANANGTCTQLPPYAKLTYENVNYDNPYVTYADIVVRFYADQACTVPIAPPLGVTLTIGIDQYNSNTGATSYDIYRDAGAWYEVIEYTAEIYYDDGGVLRTKDFYLLEGTGYVLGY